MSNMYKVRVQVVERNDEEGYEIPREDAHLRSFNNQTDAEEFMLDLVALVRAIGRIAIGRIAR